MSDWQLMTLGQISTQKKGINYKSEDYGDQHSGHPFITIKCFVKGGGYEPSGIKFYDGLSTKADYLQAGDILFSVTDLTRAGDIVGSPLTVPDFGGCKPALASMDCMRIEPYPEKCDKGFLFHRLMLPDVRRQMVSLSAGSTVLHLDTKKVPSITVQIPVSTKNQKRIASILTSIDSAIEKTESLIAKYQQIKAGLMHDLFTRGVTADGKLRPPREQAPELYRETPIGWIPKAWDARLLVKAVSQKPNAIVDGPFGSNLKTVHYRTSGIPVIQSGYVTSGFFRADEYSYITESHFQTQSRSRVNPGDIVMAKIGAQAGMCAVLPEEHTFGILAGNSLKITADNSFLQRDWLVAYLHRLYIVTGMRGFRTETAQPAISIGRLKKLLIPVPDEKEQIYGTEIIHGINHNLSNQSAFLNKLQHQKLGLMHDLLTGAVRVTK